MPVMTKEQDAILSQWEQAGLIWKLDMSNWKRFRFGLWPWGESSANPLAKLLNEGSENE